MKHYLFFANRASGTSRVHVLHELLEKRFDEEEQADYTLITLLKKKSMSQQIKEAVDFYKPDFLVACGGDGTVASVAHCASDRKLPFGIIPMGTANIFSKSIGIPDKWADALDVLLYPRHHYRHLDAMECNDRLYFLHITIGISSLISYYTPQDSKRRFGVLAYFGRVFQYMGDLHRKAFTATIDGKKKTLRATEVVIANTDVFFSRAFRLGDNIKMDDGVLHLLAFSPRSWMDHFRFLSYFMTGKPKLSNKLFVEHEFETLTINTVKPHVVMADGENIGKTPITVILHKKALTVIAPKP